MWQANQSVTPNWRGWSTPRGTPWRRGDQTGYADVVIERDTGLGIIGCKRLSEVGTYIFLVPELASGERTRFRYHWTAVATRSGQQRGWIDLEVDPATYESGFCVAQGTGPKDRPILERIGAELVTATEAICWELRERQSAADPLGLSSKPYLGCPIIVTNADLVVCCYRPGSVDLESGQLKGGKYQTVSAVRFRKPLSYSVSDRPTKAEAVLPPYGSPLRFATIPSRSSRQTASNRSLILRRLAATSGSTPARSCSPRSGEHPAVWS